MSKKSYTPNDHRSIVKNPNNPAFAAAQQNQAQQRKADGPHAAPKPPPGTKEG